MAGPARGQAPATSNTRGSRSPRRHRRRLPPTALPPRGPLVRRARGAARSRSPEASRRHRWPQQALERLARRLAVDEGLVRRVLQKPPDEVGHPLDQIADRAVDADAKAELCERMLKIVAEAP